MENSVTFIPRLEKIGQTPTSAVLPMKGSSSNNNEPENTRQHDDDIASLNEEQTGEGNDDGIDSAHEDDDSKEEKSEHQSGNNVNQQKTAPVILGGSIEKAAFCLLQGFMLDPDSKTPQPVLVPINRLPAMLGRSHNTTDKSFFGLGKNIKAVSRVQFCIDYRIPSGGTIGQYGGTTSNEFIYQPPNNNNNNKQKKDGNDKESADQQVIFNPTNAPKDEAGFYAITCKGKNPIRVNGLKVDQDQTCLLTHGSDIKISAFSLYFLLPSKPSTKTMQVTVMVKGGGGVQRKKGGTDNSNSKNVVAAATSSSKKRKAPPEMLLYSSSTAATTAVPKAVKPRRFANQGLQEDLDNMTTDELLDEMDIAVEKGTWDRRCGFMGSTVLYRAVREAAHARHVQENTGRDGVSKALIMGWIHASAKFGTITQFMQSKLEKKSYQCSITRAMQRAGYTRCSEKSFGRQVRWHLPANVEQKYAPQETGGDDGQEQDASAPTGDDDDDGDDDDENSIDASQDDASLEDKVVNGNEKDSDDDDDDDDDNGVEGGQGAWKHIKAEIDAMSTKQLLEEFHKAVENDRWDRKCQFIASAVGFRAVKEAARDANFRQCAQPDGVSRAQVVNWITESDRFGQWAVYMADKLKPRSYHSNIVKSMQLAGYHRSSAKIFGCNIRWHLPDVPINDGNDDHVVDNDNDDDDDGSGSDAQSKGSSANVKQDDSDNDNDSGSDE